MDRIETQRLLADYAKNGAEAAFREIVEAHVDFVYSTAFRRLDGDSQLAQDVTQRAFVDLARHIAKLSGEVMLGGWLHRHTCFLASHSARAERRRKARERRAVEMNSLSEPSDGPPDQLFGLLDEAVDQLPAGDRAAILLRFFEKRDFRAVGEALGSSEDAARMRVGRALDKLHLILKRRGVTCTATALAAALAADAVTSAAAGLAASATVAAVAGATASASASTIVLKLITMTKLKLGLAGALAIGAGATLLVQHQNQVRLNELNRNLRQQLDELAAANQSLSNQIVHAGDAPAEDPPLELLKLRGEVGVLNRRLAEATNALARSKPAPLGRQPDLTPQEQQQVDERSLAITKMNHAKQWMLAFMMFSDQNHGQFPTNLEQAASFAGGADGVELSTATNLFDVLYHGSLASSMNWSKTIVLRERQPVHLANGQWSRTYAMADGSSQVAVSPDGNFQNFESQFHIAPADGTPSP